MNCLLLLSAIKISLIGNIGFNLLEKGWTKVEQGNAVGCILLQRNAKKRRAKIQTAYGVYAFMQKCKSLGISASHWLS